MTKHKSIIAVFMLAILLIAGFWAVYCLYSEQSGAKSLPPPIDALYLDKKSNLLFVVYNANSQNPVFIDANHNPVFNAFTIYNISTGKSIHKNTMNGAPGYPISINEYDNESGILYLLAYSRNSPIGIGYKYYINNDSFVPCNDSEHSFSHSPPYVALSNDTKLRVDVSSVAEPPQLVIYKNDSVSEVRNIVSLTGARFYETEILNMDRDAIYLLVSYSDVSNPYSYGNNPTEMKRSIVRYNMTSNSTDYFDLTGNVGKIYYHKQKYNPYSGVIYGLSGTDTNKITFWSYDPVTKVFKIIDVVSLPRIWQQYYPNILFDNDGVVLIPTDKIMYKYYEKENSFVKKNYDGYVGTSIIDIVDKKVYIGYSDVGVYDYKDDIFTPHVCK